MKDKETLLKELQERFDIMKKELGFKVSFQELDSIFFLKDVILGTGFVSDSLSRQICARIVDTYMNWNTYLHSFIVPNPSNLLNLSESKMLNEEEKKEIENILSKSMKLVSTNTLVGLTKDKKNEAEFINQAVEFWKKTFCPRLIKIIEKINDGWSKK